VLALRNVRLVVAVSVLGFLHGVNLAQCEGSDFVDNVIKFVTLRVDQIYIVFADHRPAAYYSAVEIPRPGVDDGCFQHGLYGNADIVSVSPSAKQVILQQGEGVRVSARDYF
jgi:hypothetical protein